MDQPLNQNQPSRLAVTLKLLLPSWDFFNEFSTVSRLEFCVLNECDRVGDWHPVHPIENTRSLWRSLVDPRGNMELLEKSLIDRAATEFEELPVAARNVFVAGDTGAMLVRLAREKILKLSDRGVFPDGAMFQCRIRTSGTADIGEVIWVSPPCSLQGLC